MTTREPPSARGRWGARLLGALLKSVAFAMMLAIPLLGVWSASSLAAYWNGPIWLTIAAGALAFPVLPLLWDVWRERARAVRERATKKPPAPRVLTFSDRMILRTIALDGVFLAVLLSLWPQAIFTALSTRGDWFLEELDGADGARAAVLGLADGMEWLYTLAHDNPYATDEDRAADDDVDLRAGTVDTSDSGETAPSAEQADAGAGARTDDTSPDDTSQRRASAEAEDAGVPTDDTSQRRASVVSADAGASPDNPADTSQRRADTQTEVTGPSASVPRWPLPETVHPAVTALTADDERSLRSVASYLRAHTTSELDRAKAVHDYVATRVQYDVPALTGHRPPQDADTVFATRMGVCEGYARLFHALASATGLTSRYLVGDARGLDDPTEGEPHAWNAVQIDDAWYLVDPTWDAGSLRDGAFAPAYSSLYFLTPPDVFVADHFPDNRGWQLRPQPISRGEFHRRPNLSPRFRAQGFELRTPDRSQVEIDGVFSAVIARPPGMFLLATWEPHGAGDQDQRHDCTLNGEREVEVRCAIAAPGTYDIIIFSGAAQYGSYGSVGSFQAVRR